MAKVEDVSYERDKSKHLMLSSCNNMHAMQFNECVCPSENYE